MKITPKGKVDIVQRYSNELVPAAQLAAEYGVTRQAIYKVLKSHGVDTSKRRISSTCCACGKLIYLQKSRLRNRINVFCNDKCYKAYLNAGNAPYIKHRQGQRVARAKVAEVFDLDDNNVVHHIDKNNFNNRIDNLMVFSSQGDHIRYHRLGPDFVSPIWDGSKLH